MRNSKFRTIARKRSAWLLFSSLVVVQISLLLDRALAPTLGRIVSLELRSKIPFAVFGALNVIVAYHLFGLFHRQRRTIFALVYGASSAIGLLSAVSVPGTLNEVGFPTDSPWRLRKV